VHQTGENLATGEKFDHVTFDEKFAVKTIVNSIQAWANEAVDYTYGQPSLKMPHPIKVGHYTAVRMSFMIFFIFMYGF